MKDYTNKVVALTGAASGIGHELARQLAARGAKFSLGDIGDDRLAVVADELRDAGATVITTHVDVSDPEQLEAFAARTFDEYGSVDYVFSNAGISAVGPMWSMPLVDWQWLVNVNLLGAVNAARAFIPRLMEQDVESHFIITGSAAGFVAGWGGSGYCAVKHGLVGMAESLELDLQKAGANIKSHLVCPAYVLSNLHNSFDYRDDADWDPEDPAYQDPDYIEAFNRSVQSTSKLGMPTDAAVTELLAQLDEDRFIILTHPQYAPAIEARYHRLMSGERPHLA